MRSEEAGNLAFSWTYEAGEWEVKCAHEYHQDVKDGWIFEPCEHCGADITGVDYYPPEFESVGYRYALVDVPLSSGVYVFHPCGHTMKSITAWKEET